MRLKNMVTRAGSVLLAAALCFSLSACANGAGQIAAGGDNDARENSSDFSTKKPDFVMRGENGSRTDDPVGFQLELPAEGEEIAVLETTEGTIRIRLFEESAPIGVANFKGLILKGYYDNLTFHRIIPDFMIQGGDPDGDGTGGESLWGEDFENEINANLLNLRGALSYANHGAGSPASNSSQFFIVQSSEVDPTQLTTLSEEARALYEEHGGTPWLDGVHPVFGQVFEGMDVVDQIASFGSESGTPSKEVRIIKATLENYKK